MSLFKRGTERGLLFFFVIFLLAFFSSGFALGSPAKPLPNDSLKDHSHPSPVRLFLEISSGRHTIADSRYREVYSEGGRMLTLAVHPFFINMGRHSFGLSAGIKNFSKEGESTVTHEETLLSLLSLYLGAEYLINLKPFYPGIEMGIDQCFYEEDSPMMTTSGSTTGYHIQGSLMIELPVLNFLRMKLFVRHAKLPAREAVKVNLGGLEYGVGLVIRVGFSGTKHRETGNG